MRFVDQIPRLFSCLLASSVLLICTANAATYSVTAFTDSSSGGLAGTGPGAPGDLRAQIIAANLAGGSNTISFACAAAPCTITLTGPLPPITSNLTIDGGTLNTIVIDGASAYRVFFVDSGTVTLQNLEIQNGRAQGGAGGTADGGGGGGAGLGGGLFVNQATAAVTLSKVRFINSSAIGGAGGSYISSTPPGGGGGGMAFAGGGATANTGAPGGGGMLAVGASVSSGGGGGAGGAGGGGGGGIHTSGIAGAGSTGYAGNPGGSASTTTSGDGDGGAGGFGGGGGGGAAGKGGNGGFGGGGGGTGTGTQPGNGGPGGGGGGAGGGTLFGAGGTLGSGIGGGNSGSGAPSGGGGGAAAGAAVFVNAGSLVLANTSATGSSATAGAGGTGSAGHNGSAGTASSSSLFNYAGTVNGAATTGPLTVLDTRPTANTVTVSGSAQVGSQLTGAYVYADPSGYSEGASTLRWVRNSSNAGVSGGSDVATTRNYTLVSADVGMYLYFCVTPVAQSGTVGAEVCSSATAAVVAATAVPTLSEWAAILLATLVGAIGVFSLRRRGGLIA